MSSIQGIAKVILFVQDMQTQVRFYQDVLDLRVKFPQLENYSGEYWVEFETGQASLVLHGGGQGRTGPDSPKIAFGVGDLDKTRAELIQRGAILSEIRSPAPGVRVCDGLDPEGNSFSLDWHA